MGTIQLIEKSSGILLLNLLTSICFAGTIKSNVATIQIKALGSDCSPKLQFPAPTRSIPIAPGENYCAKINAALPGDELVFASGTYTAPCNFNISGTATKPIYLRSANSILSQRAKFSCTGCAGVSNFFEINGQYFVIKDFHFINNDADIMLRLFSPKNIIIEGNVFENTPDAQILTANSGNTDSVIFRDNTIKNVTYTALYLGCADGSCYSTNYLVENNFIDASLINNPNITGYAMEAKLNSYGTVRDNSFFNAQGPGLMVYGHNTATTPATIIEGNYFERSRNDAALNVGGGPTIVKNNIIINHGGTALFAQNYAGRNLQRNVSIINNTIVSNGGLGIQVQSWNAGAGNSISGNVIYAATPFSPSTINALMQDNSICTAASNCFKGAATASPYNFTPRTTGPIDISINFLVQSGYDFFGNSRSARSQPGAILYSPSIENLSVIYLQARPPRQARCY